ncbi:MAG TPA: hypothetical protein VGK74_22170 [Symbiobacteriaceae bacterium]
MEQNAETRTLDEGALDYRWNETQIHAELQMNQDTNQITMKGSFQKAQVTLLDVSVNITGQMAAGMCNPVSRGAVVDALMEQMQKMVRSMKVTGTSDDKAEGAPAPATPAETTPEPPIAG